MLLQIARFNKRPVPKGFKKYKDCEYQSIKYTLWRKEVTNEDEITALKFIGAIEIKEEE